MTETMDPAHACALNRPLASPRLALEPLTEAHAEELFVPLQASAIYEWIAVTAPVRVEDLRVRWAQLESRLSSDGAAACLNWVARRIEDGACVGKIDVDVHNDVATNIGYVLVPSAWGQGYATELVRTVVAHLAARGVARFVATVTAGNDASARVLSKAGFTNTRVLPDNDTIRGVKYDDHEYVYVVT